jgi:hypothetical protein
MCSEITRRTGEALSEFGNHKMNTTTTLQCWVYGDAVESIFPVEISKKKTVADLREAIKNKKPVDFRDVDPDALRLYSIPLLNKRLGELNQLSLKDKEIILPGTTKSEQFCKFQVKRQ